MNWQTLNGQNFTTLAAVQSNANIFSSTTTFNSFLPTSTLTPSSNTQLITKIFADQTYIDFTTDQTITGTKRLSNFFCTALNITPTSGGSGNRQQVYMTGTELAFVPQFNNNNYAFYCKDSVSTQTNPLNINSVSTTINNLLVSNNITGPSTTGTNNIYTNLISGGIINIGSTASSCNFDSIPIFNSDATFVGNIFSETAIYFKDIGIGSQLNQARIFKQDDYLYFDTNINYTNGYSFRTSSNDTLTITSALTTINNGLTSNGEATFNNLVHLKKTTRMYDLITPFTNYTSFYTSGNASVIYAGFAGSSIQFYCRTAGNIDVQTFYSFATANTSVVPFVASSTATFNGEADFNTWVNLKFRTRIYDVSFPQTNYATMYMINGNELVFGPNGNGDFISFYCKDATLGTLQTFKSSALGNTSLVNLTCSSSLISNNLTSPTTTSVNNIYTTLVSGGEINIGGSLGVNNIFGQTFFNSASTFNLGCSFLGSLSFNNGGTFSEIEQTSGSNLVIKNYTNSRDIILSTKSASTGQVDSLKINTTSCDILSPTLNLTSSSTINILTPNNLTGVINFLSTLTTATVNFCSTAYTSIFNLNARLAHKQVQYMNEVKTISGTSITLGFPLEQTWMFTSTGATVINVTLPTLTASYQAGFNFIFFKTASNTNSVIFTRGGSNTIRGLNSITDVTNVTRLSGTNSVGVGFYTAEVSAGNFAWISY